MLQHLRQPFGATDILSHQSHCWPSQSNVLRESKKANFWGRSGWHWGRIEKLRFVPQKLGFSKRLRILLTGIQWGSKSFAKLRGHLQDWKGRIQTVWLIAHTSGQGTIARNTSDSSAYSKPKGLRRRVSEAAGWRSVAAARCDGDSENLDSQTNVSLREASPHDFQHWKTRHQLIFHDTRSSTVIMFLFEHAGLGRAHRAGWVCGAWPPPSWWNRWSWTACGG